MIQDTIKDNKTIEKNIKDDLSLRAYFLSLKAKKIASAFYLLTDPMPSHEPLKWKLRDLSVCLMVELFKGQKNNGNNYISIKDTVTHLLSFIDVTFISGLISEMNYSILKKELSIFKNTMERDQLSCFDKKITDEVKMVLQHDQLEVSKNFVNLPVDLERSLEIEKRIKKTEGEVLESFYKRQIIKDSIHKRHNDVLYESKKNNSSVLQHKNIVSNDQTKIEDGHDANSDVNKSEIVNHDRVISTKQNGEKSFRKESILSILREGNELTIKEIISLLGGVSHSEKTVQRDLLDMVANGVIRKAGERRWSKYSVAQTAPENQA